MDLIGLTLIILTETIEGIEFREELLVILIIISPKEVIKSDEALLHGVGNNHDLVDLLHDVSLLIRSKLNLLGTSLLATSLDEGTLEHLTESLLSELASAPAISKSEGSSELGLLISDTDAHEEKELCKIHLAGLLAAKQTPDVLVHLTSFLISFAFLIEESIPLHFEDEAIRVVIAHLCESLLDLFV